jgi:asparagine synthase (glutamine-hydrolysing)
VSGITGWVDWQRDLTHKAEVGRAMAASLGARGPDTEGIWLSTRAIVGHRALATGEHASGPQPMVHGRAGNSVVISLSGALYNAAELRAELGGAGHGLTGRSDAEVVLHAYLEWGEQAVTRLNGMFALAVWDERSQELLLARDRLGAKPLYYAETGTGLLFGSEPKAVIANPLFRPQIDDEGLAELLLTPTVQTPGHGIFRGLREVRAGRTVRATRSGVRESAYWRLESRPHTDNLQTTLGTVRGLLEDIVARQTATDVPVGVLLSGGVDSSAVAALAHRHLASRTDEKLTTVSLDFLDSERDFRPDLLRPSIDAPFAHAMAGHLGTRHTQVMLDTPDLLAAQMITMQAADLPGIGDLDVAEYLLHRHARASAAMVLTGHGADEVFGGYQWYHDHAALDTPMFPWVHGRTSRLEVLAPDLLRRLELREYLADRYAEAVAEVPALPGEEGHARRMREVVYLHLTRFLPALLDRTDRMSMAAGLEARLPYTDHRLVEYLWNVPWEYKCLGGAEKGLLRKAVADLLPPQITHRPRSAFPVPRSPAYDAAVRDHLRRILADPASPLRPMLEPGKLTEVLAGPVGPWAGPGSAAWLGYLVELDIWLRQYRVSIR